MRLPFIALSLACLSVAGIAVSMPLSPAEPILAAAVKRPPMSHATHIAIRLRRWLSSA